MGGSRLWNEGLFVVRSSINHYFCKFSIAKRFGNLSQKRPHYSLLLQPPRGYRIFSTSYAPVALTPATYSIVAEEMLSRILEKVELLLEESTIAGADVEYSSGVMTLNLGSHGTFVLNKQPPNFQIWLSSPKSGPKRFDYFGKEVGWIYSRTGESLAKILSTELAEIFDLPKSNDEDIFK